jgi:hypothetical protein
MKPTLYEWYNQQMVNKSKPMTAVEWFNQQLVDRQNGKGDSRSWSEILEQANQMFQEQIAEAYRKGVEEDIYNNPLKTGNEYYNETYGK